MEMMPVAHICAALANSCVIGSMYRFPDFLSKELALGGDNMIRDSFRRFGCGMNTAKHGAALKHCAANGLDFFIYRMGSEKIKRMIEHKYAASLDIKGKSLDQVTREAMNFEYR
jgi:hypothetical protein